MKHRNHLTRIVLVIICLLTTFLLTSCLEEMENGNNTELGEKFLNSVIDNDYDAAYDLMKNVVSDSDFKDFWVQIEPFAEGATTYEIEQIGWRTNLNNGITTRVSAYQVYFDNDRSFFLQVVTRNDIDGIANIKFSDVTDFLDYSDTVLPVVKVVFFVISLLSVAFVVWMFVDCLRRKTKHKVLWAILILVGITFSITTGEESSFRFAIGVMLKTNTIDADPSIRSFITQFFVPVGAIVYLCLRKKLLCEPKSDDNIEEKI